MNYKRTLSILVIVILMIIINSFSSQTATESDKISTKIAKTIVVKLRILSEKEATDSHEIIRNADHIIRKLAHFSIYFTLGLLIFIANYFIYKRPMIALFVSWIISTLYAMFDEYYQTHIEGRGGQVMDVVIDSCGALLAGVVCLVVVLTKRNKELLDNNKDIF